LSIIVLGLLAVIPSFAADPARRRVEDVRWYNDSRLGETYNARTPRRETPFDGATVAAPATRVSPPPQQINIDRSSPPPPAARPAAMSMAESGGNCLRLAKSSPSEATLNEPFSYTLTASATCDIGNIVITDEIPDGAEFVSSEPAAERVGNKLVWKFPKMMNGQSQTIRVTLKPVREGSLTSCATGTAEPLVCATVIVGSPRLTIDKSGPETARLGSDVTYSIVVRNVGTAVAKNVVLTDQNPPGLAGNIPPMNLGDIAPGQAVTRSVTLKAAEKGRHCNVAIAKGSNVAEVRDDACTLVQAPAVDITKRVVAPGTNFIGRNVDFEIVVTNTGDVPLSNVVVTDGIPSQVRIVSAEGADVSGSGARWTVGTLGVGQSRTFKVAETTATPGRWCNTASVTTAEGLTDSAEACGTWLGITGILVELVDDPDPILVGQTTTLTLRVTNQGTVDDTNVQNTLTVDTEFEIVSTSQGTVNGRTITFPNIPVLRPKQTVEYKVVVKGVAVGDSRTRSSTISDTIRNTPGSKEPVIEMESTQVY
jgi:uncharacterized repeat protein (TIGR01451 family)